MILPFLKSKIGLLLILILILLGVYLVAFRNVQNNSKVLGAESNTCAGALDLNCDGVVDGKDTKTFINFAKSVTIVATESLSSKIKPTSTPTPTPTPVPTKSTAPTPTPSVSVTPPPVGYNLPYPGAPLCPDSGDSHDNSKFHTLWDPVRRCHYDHEHGENPFTPEVAAVFPDYNLQNLLGGVQIGTTNVSGPMENMHKHGGFKWQVQTAAPHGCEVGFEGSTVAVSADAIEYHAFGDYGIEMESRVHSLTALLRQCKPDNPTDYGYIYTVQHIDFGQRVVPYQGTTFPYPDTPNPSYDKALAPYFTTDCIGPVTQCRSSRQYVLDHNLNTNSTWTSKSSFRVSPSGSPLLAILFRVRDTYRLIDWNDQVYPFTFIWLCSDDGGLTYAAKPGCRYNNSTTRIDEITGVIPSSWDNKPGFDTDNRVGRISADGFVTRFGTLNTSCTTAGIDCHPIKMVHAFVGQFGSELSAAKVSNPTPQDTPERDIYFCNGVVCNETDSGAVSSGWIGAEN